MLDPFLVQHSDAPRVVYTRQRDGVDDVSTLLITRHRLAHMGLHHDVFEPPVDYTLVREQDLVIYWLQGSATISIAGEDFTMSPGSALFVPANTRFRHRASERNASLAFWNPAPGPSRAPVNA